MESRSKFVEWSQHAVILGIAGLIFAPIIGLSMPGTNAGWTVARFAIAILVVAVPLLVVAHRAEAGSVKDHYDY